MLCATLQLKMDENLLIDKKDLKKKEESEYIVIGCIKRMGKVIKKSIHNSPVTRNLWEGIIMDITGHKALSLWGNHISKIIENQWY